MTSERLFNSFIPLRTFIPPKQISGYAPGSYLAPFRRYGIVKGGKSPVRTPPPFTFNNAIDRQTDGHLCYSNTSSCIACYAATPVKSQRTRQYTDRLVMHGSVNQQLQTCDSDAYVLVISVRLLFTISALIRIDSPGTKHLLLSLIVALIVPALQQQQDT